jgi:hypothetical protein
MNVNPIDILAVELFKQMIELSKQLNRQILQTALNQNQIKQPSPNPDGKISIYA